MVKTVNNAINDKMFNCIKALYSNTYSMVRVNNELSSPILTTLAMLDRWGERRVMADMCSEQDAYHWQLKPADVPTPHTERDCVGFVGVARWRTRSTFDHLSCSIYYNSEQDYLISVPL